MVDNKDSDKTYKDKKSISIKDLWLVEFKNIIMNRWTFLDNTYYCEYKLRKKSPTIVKHINIIKNIIINKLSHFGVFVVLTDYFAKYNFKGSQRNVEKCLCLIYELLEGLNNNEMKRYYPYTSYLNLKQQFYIDYGNNLNTWCDKNLNNSFSTNEYRFYSSYIENGILDESLNHTTLILDIYYNNINYENNEIIEHSTKRIFGTLVIYDINKNIIHISDTEEIFKDKNDNIIVPYFININLEYLIKKNRLYIIIITNEIS